MKATLQFLAVARGQEGPGPHREKRVPSPVFAEQRHRAQLSLFPLRHSPTFATHILSRRRFHANILRITLGKKSQFSVYQLEVFGDPKCVKTAFPAGTLPQTPLGELTTLSRPPSRLGKGYSSQTPPHSATFIASILALSAMATQRLRGLDPPRAPRRSLVPFRCFTVGCGPAPQCRV